jgi:hypothetical protein
LIQIAFAQEAGSRERAKGNAVVSDSSAFSAAYWNPGMLAFKRSLSIAMHAEKYKFSRVNGSFGVENGVGNRMGIGSAIIFTDDFMLGYAGLGYRLSKVDGVGISLSVSYDMMNEYQEPLSFDLGWFRFWHEKWQSGLQIRNLGFDELRPKTFEAGVTHRNLLLSKPASVSLLLVASQDVFKGKFGFEWKAIPNGDLRFGIDGKSPSLGWGYSFNISDKIISIDYANPLSLAARLRF